MKVLLVSIHIFKDKKIQLLTENQEYDTGERLIPIDIK